MYPQDLLLLALLASPATAHGVVTLVRGANGVDMPGLTGKSQCPTHPSPFHPTPAPPLSLPLTNPASHTNPTPPNSTPNSDHPH
jgi:hypothetical protein